MPPCQTLYLQRWHTHRLDSHSSRSRSQTCVARSSQTYSAGCFVPWSMWGPWRCWPRSGEPRARSMGPRRRPHSESQGFPGRKKLISMHAGYLHWEMTQCSRRRARLCLRSHPRIFQNLLFSGGSSACTFLLSTKQRSTAFWPWQNFPHQT